MSSARMMLSVSGLSVGVPLYFGRGSVITCNLPIVCAAAAGVPATALPALVVPVTALAAGRVATALAAPVVGAGAVVAWVPVLGGAVGAGAAMFGVGPVVGVLAVLLPQAASRALSETAPPYWRKLRRAIRVRLRRRARSRGCSRSASDSAAAGDSCSYDVMTFPPVQTCISFVAAR